jgi:3-methyladenine DNA glycosylase AlkD
LKKRKISLLSLLGGLGDVIRYAKISNLVKKAVNWALRQIGKRNAALNAIAIEIAKEIQRK